MVQRLEEIPHQRKYSMANKHTKRCSTLFAVKGMQIKATVCHHYTPIRTANIFKKNINNAG